MVIDITNTISISLNGKTTPPIACKLSHDKSWIPGKSTNNTIITTFTDPCPDESEKMLALWDILRQFYESNQHITCEGVLAYSTATTIVEQYRLVGLFPLSVNFGDLEYSSDPTATIEIIWKYNNCFIV